MVKANIKIYMWEDKNHALATLSIKAESEEYLEDAAEAAMSKWCKKAKDDPKYYCWDWASAPINPN